MYAKYYFQADFFCSFFLDHEVEFYFKTPNQKPNVDDCLFQDPDFFVKTAFGLLYVCLRY